MSAREETPDRNRLAASDDSCRDVIARRRLRCARRLGILLLAVGALRVVSAIAAEAPADLPLIEAPVAAAGDTLVVLLTGDGGWAAMDRETAGAFVAAGVPVVGFDCLRYFWTRRTPEEASAALARVIAHYTMAWKRSRVLLVGYSFGADVLPFLAMRLPAALLSRVELLALIGPSPEANFEIHVADWLRDAPAGGAQPLEPELHALRNRGPRILCLYGRDAPRSLCPRLAGGPVAVEAWPGGHHLDRDYGRVARRVLAEWGKQSP